MNDISRNRTETWLTNSWSNAGYLRYEDLEISKVEPTFGDKTNWIQNGIDCLQVAVSARDKLQIPIQVCLAISLKSRRKPIGINFRSYKELEKQFTLAPPALYAFSPDQQIWSETPHIEMFEDWLNIKSLGIQCYYVEYLPPNESDPDYRRSLWFVSG